MKSKRKVITSFDLPIVSSYFRAYRDKTGDWRWKFVAANGKVLADSAEGYRRKIDCLAALEYIRFYGAASSVRFTIK